MKNRKSGPELPDKIKLQLTPMIDLAFNLLAFFVLSYKLSAQEGDFDVKMPLAAAAGPANIDPTVPMNIRLVADARGDIGSINVNGERSFESFDELHEFVVGTVGSEGGPTGEGSNQEATLDVDYTLRWEETIAAVTAISGYRNTEGDVVSLIQNVKFTPPKAP